eukprot:TRINITY_DN6154_c0_g3_i1.p1 TRINITY_DN6154_c0_g3~~TRINITY_DN6154_c0_g3_i1.p1  ORF type:complete len:299 (+),score=36.28 TRINITY_DN6154_c0_g3_i1:103-999(+)
MPWVCRRTAHLLGLQKGLSFIWRDCGWSSVGFQGELALERRGLLDGLSLGAQGTAVVQLLHAEPLRVCCGPGSKPLDRTAVPHGPLRGHTGQWLRKGHVAGGGGKGFFMRGEHGSPAPPASRAVGPGCQVGQGPSSWNYDVSSRDEAWRQQHRQRLWQGRLAEASRAGSGAGGASGWHGTTVLCVRKGGSVVIMADGQVTQGAEVVKPNVRKVRRMGADGNVIAGFAGSTVDAFSLLERLEARLEEHPGQLMRAAVELAKLWRSDKFLRRLDASGRAGDMLLLRQGRSLTYPDGRRRR